MTQRNENLIGALWMIGSMAAFVMNDAFMKAAGEAVPLSQAVFLRGVATTVLMAVLAWRLGGLRFDFSRRDWRLIGMRNLTEIGAAYFFLTAIFNMPIANATAILQVLPLTVTLVGAVFLGEKVGPRRWLMIGIGFFGVLLIVRPGFDGFTIYSLYVLVAVALVTTRDIISRQFSAEVPSMTIAFFNAWVVMAAFGVATLFQPWEPVPAAAGVSLMAAACIVLVAYICSISAMRVGELAVTSPFRYTAILWSLLIGLIFFDEWPDALTLVGAAIVVATGIAVIFFEQRAKERSRPLRD